MATKTLHATFVAIGTLEVLLFGGTVFGWASLEYIFKLEGYFSDTCDNDLRNISFRNIKQSVGSLDSVSDSNKSSTLQYEENYEGNISSLTFLTHNSSNNALLITNFIAICREQASHLNLVYTLAVCLNGISLFLNGFIIDRFGIRVARIVSIITYVSAALMIAFSSKENSFILYPGMFLLSYGGYLLLMTNFQLANLFVSKRSTIISLMCGAYDSSAFILILVKFAYEGGIPVRGSFLFLIAIFTICIVSTFCQLPKKRIPFPPPEGYRLNFPLTKIVHLCPGEKNDSSEDKTLHQSEYSTQAIKTTVDKSVEESLVKEKTKSEEAEADKKIPSFKECVFSKLFLWDLFWLTCQRFANWSFVGRLNTMLNRLTDSNSQIVGKYLSIYASMQFFGIFIAPLSGMLMDRKKQTKDTRESTQEGKKIDRIEMSIASFLLDTVAGILLSIAITIPVLELQYASFVFHIVHRACLYGPNTAFIANAFPMEHFGKLFGLGMTVSALFSLLQYPLYLLILGPLDNDPLVANLLVVLLVVLSCGHPIHIWVWCRRQRAAVRREDRAPIFKPKSNFSKDHPLSEKLQINEENPEVNC